MKQIEAKRLSFQATPEKGNVSALFIRPTKPKALLILGHGSGSDMRTPFLEGLSQALAKEKIATFRYNYPYSEKGGGGLNGPKVLRATIQQAVAAAKKVGKQLPLFIGGHSMSGRLSSLTHSEDPLPHVQGFVYLAFPCSGKTKVRTDHFQQIELPMLFVQGTRDQLTPLKEIQPIVKKLKTQAKLYIIETADHGFKVLKKVGKTPEEVQQEIAERISTWMDAI